MQPSFTVNTTANLTLGGGTLFGTAAIMGEATTGTVDLVKVFTSMSELKDYYGTGSLVDAAQQFFKNGGQELTTLRIKDTPIDTDYTTALSSFLITKDWDYLIIPGETTDVFHALIVTIINTRAANENKYSTFVTGVDKFEAIATSTARIAEDINGTIVVCHTALFTGTTEAEKLVTENWLDATYTAAALVGKLCSLSVNDSPTFKPVNMIGGNSLTSNDYTKSEKDTLIDAGFIVIDKTFTDVYGVILGITRNGDVTDWTTQLDAKRKVDYIKENVFNIAKTYIGQPNDNVTRQSLKANVLTFMNTTIKDRIIENAEVEVLVGATPQSVILNASVKLISEVDFITFNLTLNL